MVLAWVLANMILAARMNAVHAGRQTIIVKDIALICKVTKTIEGYTTSLKKWRMLNQGQDEYKAALGVLLW
jgi:hypothetical protein